jgi:tryptophan synthase alpha chain
MELAEAGADVIELGIPFSDPLADGRVNQMASARALAAGTTVAGVLDCAAEIRKRSEIPLVLFTYLNPIHAYGLEKLAADAAGAGIDGCLCLDLPVEESGDYVQALRGKGLDTIFLVAPTSPDARIRRVARAGSGFVYCVSREGVTGMQRKLSPAADRLLKRTRTFTDLPMVLGFGVSSPGQARAAVRHAEAVVVGSAIVDRFFQEPKTAAGRRKAAAWVKTLVDAVKEV